ncbi:Rv0909 family putative TA system antitoxin [Arthrobacter sp. H5]|uniref:Rv0909 family putative TA system antitoxin n=1 Tax=Arthrobacter sp. H5 TaxID=1267973 RepID=UPI0004B94E8B|nr:Rv0909 family putative TA system antitoxin [Arthrobacter sp. H5]
MAGFSSLSKIARELARNPKVKSALTSPQAKQAGSRIVDRAASIADKATKGKHQSKIESAREQARKRLGPSGDGPHEPGRPGF